jgi:hypothetical protein
MNFLPLLFALILSAVKARILLTYPENNETAKKAFVMLFSKFDIDRIRDCGDKLSVSHVDEAAYNKIIDDNWQDHNNAIDISNSNDPEQDISSTNNSDQEDLTRYNKFAPTNAKKLGDFKSTVKVVTDKKDAITACKSEKDLVDSFPEKYNEEKSVEQAMEAYSAALVKSNEVVLKEE